MSNLKPEWHVRISVVEWNLPKRIVQEDKYHTIDEANTAIKVAQTHVHVLNSLTHRNKTYYVEPLFHGCSQTS